MLARRAAAASWVGARVSAERALMPAAMSCMRSWDLDPGSRIRRCGLRRRCLPLRLPRLSAAVFGDHRLDGSCVHNRAGCSAPAGAPRRASTSTTTGWPRTPSAPTTGAPVSAASRSTDSRRPRSPTARSPSGPSSTGKARAHELSELVPFMATDACRSAGRCWAFIVTPLKASSAVTRWPAVESER